MRLPATAATEAASVVLAGRRRRAGRDGLCSHRQIRSRSVDMPGGGGAVFAVEAAATLVNETGQGRPAPCSRSLFRSCSGDMPGVRGELQDNVAPATLRYKARQERASER
jgi:hypothetical protein